MNTRLFLFFFIVMSFKANSAINLDANKPCEFEKTNDLQKTVEESIKDKEEIVNKELEELRTENKKLKEDKKKEISSDDSSSILLMSQLTSLLSSQQMIQMQMMQMMSQMQMNSSYSMNPYLFSPPSFQLGHEMFNPYTQGGIYGSGFGGFGVGIPFQQNPYSQLPLDRQMISPSSSFGFNSPIFNNGFDFSQNNEPVIHEPFESDLNTFSRILIDKA